jgi:hypothetical protein
MSTIKISQLGNLTTVQGNTIVPVVSNVAGTLTTLQSNVEQLQTYILGTVVTDLANLTASTTANAAVQSGAIADVTTAWQANAVTQLNQIEGANAAIVTANTALKGYVDAANTIQSNEITAISNSVTGANAAIVTANTALKGYVDAANTIQSNEITAISNSVTGANAAIVTANTAMKGYVDAANTIQSNEITIVTNSVTGANAAIVTANTAMKGYVDAANTIQSNEITAISNSVTGANAAIVTANTAMKGYVDANNATQLTSINNITNGTATFRDIVPTSNIAYTLGNLSYQWSGLYTESVSATGINLPSNSSISTASINGLDYVLLAGPNTGAAAMIVPSGNIAIANGFEVAQTYANVVIHNANTAVTHTWQFTQDGNLTVPGNINPSANVTYSLGSETAQWKDLWISGNTIHIGGSSLSISGNTLVVNGQAQSALYDLVTSNVFLQDLPGGYGNVTLDNTTRQVLFERTAGGASDFTQFKYTVDGTDPATSGTAISLFLPELATQRINVAGNLTLKTTFVGGTGGSNAEWYIYQYR